MNRLIGLLFFFLTATPSPAQFSFKKDKNDAAYMAALEAFRQKKYAEALEMFAPLTRDYSNQERSVYSHYYYANAAHYLDKDKEGWNMLQQLLSRYPNWAQKDEVYYLSGLLNFKLKNYYRALDYLNRISTSSFQKDVGGLKQHYLSGVTDVATLKGLHKQFPGDRILASYLIKAIQSKPGSDKADQELAKNLVLRFKLSSPAAGDNRPAGGHKPGAPQRKAAEKKHYDIAVLLPYRIDAFEASNRSRSNQYVFDYHQGLLMAQKQLKKEKIDVRIQAYDIGNVRHSVSNLTHTPEFANADLILGPLHPETSEEAAEYSRKSDVPVVNPLSTDSKLLTKQYPGYFITHASLGLQARQVAQVAKTIGSDVSAVIYYGESSKDSSLAMLYADEVKEQGGRVLAMKRTGSTHEAMAEAMADGNGDLDPSHVVLFSTDPRSGRAFLNLMRGAGFEQTPLIATATSFDRYNTDFSVYSRDIYLLDTDFIDLERQDIKNFQYEYYLAYNTLPSVYSYQGYDHLLFFGRKLDKYKEKVAEGIGQTRYSDRQGYLLGGFDFSNSRENAVFSIRKYQGSSWVTLEGVVAGN